MSVPLEVQNLQYFNLYTLAENSFKFQTKALFLIVLLLILTYTFDNSPSNQ
jgi:hypothetical protein